MRPRSLAADLRHALDPVAFAVERLGWTPDPWQARVLRPAAKRLLLNCSRQSGKSTTAAVLALHTALYTPASLTLLVSPSLRQSRELFAKTSGFLRKLEPTPICEEDNKLSFALSNGARVVSLPGSPDTIRGFSSVDLLIADEAAYVADDLFTAVRPMLAVSGGRMILMSTPAGQRGHFHACWSGPEEAWERVLVPASEVPRIDRRFLEAERRALGDMLFRQEYEGAFLSAADCVFSPDDIQRALSDSITPLFPPGDGAALTPLFGDAA